MSRPAKLGARDSASKRWTMALMAGSSRTWSWPLSEWGYSPLGASWNQPSAGRANFDVLGDVPANFGGGFLGMAFDLDHVRDAAAEAAFEGPVRVHVFGVFHGELRIRKSGRQEGKFFLATDGTRMKHGRN